MKKDRILLVIIIMITAPSLLLAQSSNYTIKGKVGHLSYPAKAYLEYSDAAGDHIDSALVNDGKFNFNGKIGGLEDAVIVINKKGTGKNQEGVSYKEFYIEPATINIVSADSLENATINGGTANAENEKLAKALAPVNVKMRAFFKDYKAELKEIRNSKGYSDALEKKDKMLENERKAVYLKFIKANPNSFVSLLSLTDYLGSRLDTETAASLFNMLSADIRATQSGVRYAACIQKAKVTAAGKPAPEFSCRTADGTCISLKDLRGKYVLSTFGQPGVLPVMQKFQILFI